MIPDPLAEAPPPAADSPADSAPPWSYTVSVRSLCEFTAKRGDLDRRFTPSATALEGLIGQGAVTSRRGQDYETEVALEGVYGSLRVRGRADGYDPRRRCLEEIKTIRGEPDDIPANRRHLHWAQLQTYGALFCRDRGLQELTLALVYFDIASQTEVELRELFSAADLEAALAERCERFEGWAEQESRHRCARDAGLAALAFPPGAFRAGQRILAEAVYRAATAGRCLLAQAPTGIGKTVGTLFPMLRAMPGQRLDKIAYLTCKGTGRLTALEALEGLRAGTAGQALRVLTMVAKDQACEHPDKACHGDACPLARGFYDRLPAAREEAVAAGFLGAETQRRVALRHGICPYYLGQELLRWADVLVGDVNHAFDPNGALWGLSQSQGWRLGMLVDEAHNLVDRARQMYSAELQLGQIAAAAAAAPAALRPVLERLGAAASALAKAQDSAYAVLDTVPDRLATALLAASAALGEHFQRLPTAVGPLLHFHFGLQHFVRLAESLGEHSLFDIQRGSVTPVPSKSVRGSRWAPGVASGAASGLEDATLSLRNVLPAPFLRPRFAALQGVVLFSATLGPPDYPTALLGLPANTAWLDVPPAFPAEHLQVQVADRISTRYAHRDRSLQALVDVIADQFDAHSGNYLAFFSSHDYLQQAAARLAAGRPDIAQWRQDRLMETRARQDFLDRFVPGGRGIGFAVLGGVFAEGVDLPGSRLIGAFIATLGLPPVSPAQSQFRARIDAIFGAEQGYADLVPALQKVVQAAGRVLRTPEDRGWLWLMDDRYRQPEVARLLPSWWQIAPTEPTEPRTPPPAATQTEGASCGPDEALGDNAAR
jgi:Rad3-related DNA helicase